MSKLGPCDPDPTSTVKAMTDAPRDEALTDATQRARDWIEKWFGPESAFDDDDDLIKSLADEFAAVHRAPSAPQAADCVLIPRDLLLSLTWLIGIDDPLKKEKAQAGHLLAASTAPLPEPPQ